MENLKVRLLNLAWKELARDVQRTTEFDQSQLFRKIYSEEFDTPGGEPFGVLIGDYEIHPRASAAHPIDDVSVLATVSQVAAAAFAPFIAAAHPSMLELESFQGLERSLDLPRTFEQLDYLKWRAFRETEDARFVGLTLPRVLIRTPYEDDGSRVDGFVFREQTGSPDGSGYLWGNAAYALAAVLCRSFDESRWLAGIRGVRRSVDGGGIVPGLPVHCFGTDRVGVVPKSSTEVLITDPLEQELSELGFIPLCHCPDTELSVFYSNSSVQKPKRYDEMAATINADLGHAPIHALRVAIRALLEDHRPRQDRHLPGGERVRTVLVRLAPPVRHVRPRRQSRGQGGIPAARSGGSGPAAPRQAGLLPVRGPSLAALRSG